MSTFKSFAWYCTTKDCITTKLTSLFLPLILICPGPSARWMISAQNTQGSASGIECWSCPRHPSLQPSGLSAPPPPCSGSAVCLEKYIRNNPLSTRLWASHVFSDECHSTWYFKAAIQQGMASSIWGSLSIAWTKLHPFNSSHKTYSGKMCLWLGYLHYNVRINI